jgi:ADP-ribose pyrophosphatase
MKIDRIEPLTHEKWLNLYAANFTHGQHTGRWVYASRRPQPVADRRPDAVLIVPLLHQPPAPPRLVLVKEFRVPVGDYIHAFPAGLLAEGESPEDTARREMLEETGLTVTAVKQVSPVLFSSAGLTDESVMLVYVDAQLVPGGAPHLDSSEELEVVLLDYDGVCRLADDHTGLFDAKVWPVLAMYRQLGHLS